MSAGQDFPKAGTERWAEDTLWVLGRRGDAPFNLMEGALALATFDAPNARLAAYHTHLDGMVQEAGALAGPSDPAAVQLDAITRVLFKLNGYQGDSDTYDDLQNANLIRVIDRRKGLPVALGILMIHLARAQGWEMQGLDFPGHFLVRLDTGSERLITDPFHGGAVLDTPALRALLKATEGNDAELNASHYEPMPDRDILLRLQNNIKIRLIQSSRVEEAAGIVDSMLLMAPERFVLWRESGLINAHIGNIRSAISAFEHYVQREPRSAPRQEIQAVLDELRAKLN